MAGFDFSTPEQILFGPGRLSEAGRLAAGLGRRALVTAGTRGAGLERLLALLDAAGVAYEVCPVTGEPDVPLVQAGLGQARAAGCELVIGFGGGSAIDTGKAISALLTNPGDPLDYLEVVGNNQPLTRQAAPMIAIPTTAGTGSEVTRNAVLAVPGQQVKVSLRSPLMLPRVALVDPELTYCLPPALTAVTGMDALAQVIEPFVSARANPLTDLYCREGIVRVGRSLLHAYQQGSDQAAREDMAFASLMGGLALANAGLGAVHGFAGPLGGMFAAPHGAVCAALLPAVVQVNARALCERAAQHPAVARYRLVAQWVTGDPQAETLDLVAWLEELRAQLGIAGLGQYGLRQADIARVVEKSAQASSMKANPITLSGAELSEILTQSL
jgi:alcohol dehydrogenase class IV